jgi:hypothetical protein
MTDSKAKVMVEKFFGPGLRLVYKKVIADGVESLELVEFTDH